MKFFNTIFTTVFTAIRRLIKRILGIIIMNDGYMPIQSSFTAPNYIQHTTHQERKHRDCVILVPCNGGIEPKCDEALRILESRGYEVWRTVGFSCISQGRSKMTYDAIYRRGFKEILWIDSDIVFNPDDVDRIIAHNLPLVGAAYPMKGWPVMTVAPINQNEIVFDEYNGGLIEVEALATGFLYIKSEVFFKLKERFNLPICNTSFSAETIPFFRPEIWSENGTDLFLGEDFSFSKNCKAIGYKPMLDTRIKLKHIGKYEYSWEDVINQTGRICKPNTGKPLIYKELHKNSNSIGQIG